MRKPRRPDILVYMQEDPVPIHRIVTPNVWMIVLAMMSGAAVMFLLASFGVIDIPPARIQPKTVTLIVLGLVLVLYGWHRLLRRRERR